MKALVIVAASAASAAALAVAGELVRRRLSRRRRGGAAACVEAVPAAVPPPPGVTVTSVEQLEALACGPAAGTVTCVELQHHPLAGAVVPAALLQLSALRRLDLGKCGLTSLPDGIFLSLKRLEVLLLSNNALAQLPTGLGGLSSLTQLDLGMNSFAEVPAGLCDATSLRTLNLVGNRLAMLPPDFGRLERLRLLGLKSNALTHLPDSFSRLTGLVELFLTDNRLVDLPAGVSCLTSLVKLQASFNRFTALPEGLLRLPHLEMMRVAVCDIRSLPPGLQAGSASGVLPKLAWCSVAGNPCCPEAPAAAPGLPTVAREELELGQKLGDGASGEVFRAVWHGDLVAVKFFHSDVSPDGRTEDEVALAVGLAHPHLTQVLAMVRKPNLGLVLRLEQGVPMALKPTSQHLLRCKWADDVRFEVRPALAVARAVADALRYCHGKGVCHGDVYGHNVLVDEDMHATLCDFGASFSYSPQQEPFWEAMEVRAYGLLLRDIALRTAAPEAGAEAKAGAEAEVVSGLRDLASRCADLPPAERPRFSDVCTEVRALQAAL